MPAHSILAYGASRTSKTSQFRFIAEHVFRTTGKKSRFITTDTGSRWQPFQDLVDAGIIEALFFPTDPTFNPFSTMRKLRRGEWPKEGILRPSFKENGKWKSRNEWLRWEDQANSSEIGAYGVESLTTFGTGGMRDLAEKNVTVGNAAAPGFRTEDDENYASNTMQHYGMAQGEILELLNALAVLPIDYVYTTALEGMGETDDGPIKRAVPGPKVPGKAIIEVIPSRVNDCLRFVDAVDGDKREIRCYIRPHADAQVAKITWPAGLRNLNIPEVLAAVDKKWPRGFFVLSHEKGIGELLEFQEEMKKLAKTRTDQLLASAKV